MNKAILFLNNVQNYDYKQTYSVVLCRYKLRGRIVSIYERICENREK